MSSVKYRAQNRVVEQAEIVALVKQERSLPVGKLVIERSRGNVIGTVGVGGEQFEQDQQQCFATSAHRREQRQSRRDWEAAEDVSV